MMERDAALEHCKKQEQLIEEIKKAKEQEQPTAPIDIMSNEQVQNYVQNLKQQNMMLDKELRTQ